MLKKKMLKLMLAVFAISSLFYMENPMENGSVSNTVVAYANTKKKAICKVDKLNVRTDAGTTFPPVYVGEASAFMTLNQEAEVLSEKNGWYQVRFSFNNETVKGFVIGEFVEVKDVKTKKKGKKKAEKTETKKTPSKQMEKVEGSLKKNREILAKVSADALKVRKEAGVSAEQLTLGTIPVKLKKEETVSIFGMKKDEEGKIWYRIKAKFSEQEVDGYAHSDFIKLSVSKKASVLAEVSKKDGIFLYKKATDEKSFVKNKKGSKIKLLKGKSVEIFYEINLDGKKYFKILVRTSKEDFSGYTLAETLQFRFQKEEKPKDTEEEKENLNKQEEDTGENSETETETPKNEKNKVETIEEEMTAEDSIFRSQKGIILSDDTILYNEASFQSVVLVNVETKLPYKLKANSEVMVRKQYTRNKIKWYLITYSMTEDGQTVTGAGFVPAEKVRLTGELVGNATSFPDSWKEMSKEDFERMLEKEGFPESYKEKLRLLHEKHPTWRFEARKLGIDWEDAVSGESRLGLNLIYNNRNVAWKSLEKGAYNWEKDSFIVFDGHSFVNVSNKALRYFMDPRNFLDEQNIFQFELLSYNPIYHTEEGIEKLLADSPMEGEKFTFINEFGEKERLSYAEAFLLAGIYSGVSPYHLATRAKQEVAGGGEFSASASGKLPGFENIFNFYNIGANDSPLPLGAVKNGLGFAKNGRKNRIYNDKLSFNQYIKIPWNNRYRALLGGAAYIGNDYISQGQNTIYLEKFNLTENSTFFHQYMSSVEGPVKEAAYLHKVYKELENLPLVFSIPVIENMPVEPEEKPIDEKNPNNWLSGITVSGYQLMPLFSPDVTEGYEVKVGKKEKTVLILTNAVNKKAEVSGAGVIPLKTKGSTLVELEVKAENGNIRVYKVKIVKEG